MIYHTVHTYHKSIHYFIHIITFNTMIITYISRIINIDAIMYYSKVIIFLHLFNTIISFCIFFSFFIPPFFIPLFLLVLPKKLFRVVSSQQQQQQPQPQTLDSVFQLFINLNHCWLEKLKNHHSHSTLAKVTQKCFKGAQALLYSVYSPCQSYVIHYQPENNRSVMENVQHKLWQVPVLLSIFDDIYVFWNS